MKQMCGYLRNHLQGKAVNSPWKKPYGKVVTQTVRFSRHRSSFLSIHCLVLDDGHLGGILTLIDLPCWAYCCSFALGYWVNASGGRSIDRHWPMVSSCLFTYSWSQALPDLLLFAPDGQWLDAAWSCGRFVYQLRGIYWPPPYYLLNAKRESVHFRPFGDAAEVGLPVREDQCVGATESTRRSELVFRFLSITSSCLGWTLSLPSQLFHLLPPDTVIVVIKECLQIDLACGRSFTTTTTAACVFFQFSHWHDRRVLMRQTLRGGFEKSIRPSRNGPINKI
ncbi:hypothetical protein T07_11747 [Trichinella nelsoni]|uniref:Uncharacterized protein n=1 Tax=Trichinella nelsoni TaxID=6336 RepID=A0A0V0SKS8_9BILA|nr:hypothetical protein T07_11747 [Trichinella nelsoni]